MPDKKKVIDFFMNLDFGKCFENILAAKKEERIRVFLGMTKDSVGATIGVSVCSPTTKQPVEIHCKLNHINPKKTLEEPICSISEYESFFQKTLSLG